MTQEEKAKAYDEAIERARQFSKYPLLEDSADIVEYIFPELKESEDEKIRKTLIRFFSDNYPNETEMYDGTVTVGKALAWLEKQESVEEIVERCKTSWYNEGKIQGQIEGLTSDEKYWQGWHDALEKQVDNANNFEPIKLKEPDVYEYELERIVDKLNEVIGKLGDIHQVLSKPCVFPYRDYAPPQEPWYEIQQKTHGVERVTPVTCETTNEVKAEDGKDV